MVTSENIVLCGANSYEEKYYFNQVFQTLPVAVQKELQIMCVLFTEEVGGILTLEYLKDGSLVFKTMADDGDYLYDEIEAGLQVRKLREEKQELLEALEQYYKVLILHETD